MAVGFRSDLASYLADLVAEIGSASLGSDLRSKVRQHMLDGLASAFIGCKSNVFGSLSGMCPRGVSGQASAGGAIAGLAPADAAMLWAYAINASVFEDGSREGACHPAPVVVSTIVALSGGKSWDLIDGATVAGYDVMVRLTRSGNPEFTRKGFHPTAIAGPFAAAATASVLMGLDPAKTKNALCIAALGSSGLMASFKCGPTQPLQVAWGVRSGITAALLAADGHEGYPRILEDGFFPAYLGRDPSPPLDHPLDHGYAVLGGYLKPYPGCRHLHPSIDALARILDANALSPAEMKLIRVRTYKTAVETEIHNVKSRGDAYFNIPYALAARAVLGRCDHDAFDEKHFGNEEMAGLMKRTEVLVDPDIDRLYPKQRGAAVEVHTQAGQMLVEQVSTPLGEPENPLPLSSTKAKLRNTAKDFLSEADMERIERLVSVAGDVEPAGELFRLLSEKVLAR